MPLGIKQIEVGTKGRFYIGSHALQYAIDVYDLWSHDQQRNAYFDIDGSPASVTQNVPSSDVRGVEISGQALLTSWLTLSFNGAYTDARYIDGRVAFHGQEVEFNTYADTPKWTGSLAFTASLPVPADVGVMKIHADAYAQSSQWLSNFGYTIVPDTRLPSYELVNFRYDWQGIAKTKFSLGLFIKNAFNKIYYQGGYALGAVAGYNLANPGAPRMFGAEITYKW